MAEPAQSKRAARFWKLTAPCPVAVRGGDSTEVAPIRTVPRARVLLKALADRGALGNAGRPYDYGSPTR